MDIDFNEYLLQTYFHNEEAVYKHHSSNKALSLNSDISRNEHNIKADEYLQIIELGRDFNTDVRVYLPYSNTFDLPIYLSRTAYTINLGRISNKMDILDFRKLFHECCLRSGYHIESNYMNNLSLLSDTTPDSYNSLLEKQYKMENIDLSSELYDIHYHDKLVYSSGSSMKQIIVYITYYIGVWRKNMYSVNKSYVIDFRVINDSNSYIKNIIHEIQKQFNNKNHMNYDWNFIPYYDTPNKNNKNKCKLTTNEINTIATILCNKVSV